MRKTAVISVLVIGACVALGGCPPPPTAQTLGNCYESNNCTPPGNPPPGWGGMTRAQCKAAPGASWRAVNRQAQEVGACIVPP